MSNKSLILVFTKLQIGTFFQAKIYKQNSRTVCMESFLKKTLEGKGDEDGDSLLHNGTQKAQFAWENRPDKSWVAMADDSGLFLEALDGKPGVHAATWAGEEATTEEILEHTLHQMEGKENRTAKWQTCAVLISPEGKHFQFYGECPGQLLQTPQAPFQPSMPYSGIFKPNGLTKVMSEMTPEEENGISHRGKAFFQARKFLESL